VSARSIILGTVALLLAVVFGLRALGGSAPAAAGWWQPAASDNLRWQLQLQGDLQLVEGVNVYAVDSAASQASLNAAKARGARLMCYISAGSAENWRDDFNQFPDAVVGNEYYGWPGEWWLDIRQIELLAPIMRARMDVCRDKGFDVLDADNINGYENDTGFTISSADAVAYVRWLAAEAHSRGMAFSLKNGEALLDEVALDVDMMQSESCYRYGNCKWVAKMTALNKPVFSVEYEDLIDEGAFRSRACETARQYQFSMIYRDTELLPAGIYRSCH
jgi:hypothetical protein